MQEGEEGRLLGRSGEQVVLESVTLGQHLAGVEGAVEREDAVVVWTVLEVEGVLEEVDEAVSGARRLLEEVEDGA